jgi:hypothetical protein
MTYDARGELQLAALNYDRSIANTPFRPRAESAPRLKALAAYVPPQSAPERTSRDLSKAQALLDGRAPPRSPGAVARAGQGGAHARAGGPRARRHGPLSGGAHSVTSAQAQFAPV